MAAGRRVPCQHIELRMRLLGYQQPDDRSTVNSGSEGGHGRITEMFIKYGLIGFNWDRTEVTTVDSRFTFMDGIWTKGG